MALFEVNIGGKTFEIDARSEADLPDIVDDIALKEGLSVATEEIAAPAQEAAPTTETMTPTPMKPGAFSQVTEFEKGFKQQEAATQVAAADAQARKAKAVAEQNDPANWSAEKTRQYYQQNQPKNIQEAAQAKAAIQTKEQQEKTATEQLQAKALHDQIVAQAGVDPRAVEPKPVEGPIGVATPEQIAAWQKAGPINFAEMGGKLDKTEMIPFNPESAVKAINVYKAAMRLRNNEYQADEEEMARAPIGTTEEEARAQIEAGMPTREADAKLIRDFLLKREEEAVRGVTIGGEITRGVAQLPAFMVEFLATGGLEAVGKQAVTKVAKTALEKGVPKMALKGAAWTAGGLARTLGMPHKVAEGFVERQTPEMKAKGDEIIIAAVNEKPATSFLRAYGDMVIENMSEVAGGALGKAAGKVGEAAGKIAPKPLKEAATVLVEAFKKLKPTEKISKLMSRAGYHGFLEEMGEERLGALMRAVTGVEGQGNLFERLVQSIPTGRELLIEAGVLSVPGAAGAVVSKVAEKTGQVIEDRQKEQAKYQAEREYLESKIKPRDLRTYQIEAGEEAAMKKAEEPEVKFYGQPANVAVEEALAEEEAKEKKAAKEIVIPETGTAERTDVANEVRSAGARTIKQIQDLYPERGLSREEAREIRNAAWGTKAGEVSAPVAEAPKEEAAVVEKPAVEKEYTGEEEVERQKNFTPGKTYYDHYNGKKLQFVRYDNKGNPMFKDLDGNKHIRYKVDEPGRNLFIREEATEVEFEHNGKTYRLKSAASPLLPHEAGAKNYNKTGKFGYDLEERGQHKGIKPPLLTWNRISSKRKGGQVFNSVEEAKAFIDKMKPEPKEEAPIKTGIVPPTAQVTDEEVRKQEAELPGEPIKEIPAEPHVVEINDADRTEIEELKAEIEEGEPVVRKVIDDGYGNKSTIAETEMGGLPYPDYFKGQGLKKKETLAIIEKVLAGKKITPKQRRILDGLRERRKAQMDREDERQANREAKEAEKDLLAEEERKAIQEENAPEGEVVFPEKPAPGKGETTTKAQKPSKEWEEGGRLEKGRVEMPELVKLATDMMKKIPVIKRLAKYAGYFKGGPGGSMIALDYRIFQNVNSALATLAHEIGHLWDWIPDRNLRRGNVLGRIGSLLNYLKTTIDKLPTNPSQALTDADRADIRKKSEAEAKTKFTENMSKKDKADMVKKIYSDMIKEEIKKRNLITRDEIMAELKEVTKWWSPFDENADPGYTNYRFGSDELYAEAISVMLNRPEKLAEMAPKFLAAFNAYIERKPEVKEALKWLEDMYNMPEADRLKLRQKDIREGFKAGEAGYKAARERQEKKLTARQKILKGLSTKFALINEKVAEARKRGSVINPADDPQYALEEYNYLAGKIKSLLDTFAENVTDKLVDAGLTIEDLGEYLLLNRIVLERQDLANPYGHTRDTAAKGVEFLSRQLGPEKFKALQDIEEAFRKIVYDGLIEAKDLYGTAKVQELLTNPAYATFQVLDYIDDYVSPAIIRQIGTFKGVANPVEATLLKMISMKRAAERNKARLSTIRFLGSQFPGEIEKAKMRFINKFRREPVEKEGFGTVVVMEDGKMNGYYVDPYIADTLAFSPPVAVDLATEAVRTMNSGYFRPVYVGLNLGFQAFNAMRDFVRAWKLNPHATFPQMIKEYSKAHKAAASRIWGDKVDPIIKEMEAAGVLSVTYNDMLRGTDTEEKQIEYLYDKYDVRRKGMTQKQKSKYGFLVDPVLHVIRILEETGNYIETLPKVAGYMSRKGKVAPARLGHEVRIYSGSPDFLTRGDWYQWSNNWFLFSNAIIQGIRSDIEGSFRDPTTRSGYWYKTAMTTIVPKLAMVLASIGFFGDPLKEMYDGMSEYDKANYTCIPLGYTEDGRVVYLRIPQDEMGRLYGGITWKAFTAEFAKHPVKSTQDIISFMAGQVPSFTPAVDLITKWSQFLGGKNPYDMFRERNILTQEEMDKGGWVAIKPMLKHTAGILGYYGATIRMRNEAGSVERVVRSAPVLQRFIRYGSKNPEERAYGDVMELKKEFLKTVKGRGGAGEEYGPRTGYYKDLKRGLREHDPKLIKSAMAGLEEQKTEDKDILRSLKAASPLSGLSEQDQIEFIKWLKPEDAKKVQRAIAYYEKTFPTK